MYKKLGKLRSSILIMFIFSIVGSTYILYQSKPVNNDQGRKLYKKEKLNINEVILTKEEINLSKLNSIFNEISPTQEFINGRILFEDYNNINKGKTVLINYKGLNEFNDFKVISLNLKKVKSLDYFAIGYIYKLNNGTAFVKAIYDRNVSENTFLLQKGLSLE